MENKFTKGVLERQEREYNKQSPGQPSVSQNEYIPAQSSPSVLDLSDLFDREAERKAKNKTFYLDVSGGSVIQAIKKTASDYHVTESKLVNDILKKILFSQN